MKVRFKIQYIGDSITQIITLDLDCNNSDLDEYEAYDLLHDHLLNNEIDDLLSVFNKTSYEEFEYTILEDNQKMKNLDYKLKSLFNCKEILRLHICGNKRIYLLKSLSDEYHVVRLTIKNNKIEEMQALKYDYFNQALDNFKF